MMTVVYAYDFASKIISPTLLTVVKKCSRSSYKERRENDLASGAEEGRDKLR